MVNHSFCLTNADAQYDVRHALRVYGESFLNNHQYDSEEDDDNSAGAELSITYTQLQTIPDILYSFVWLRKLTLNHHNICELPETIGNLHKLQYLSLEHNKLTSLPNAVGDLVLLETLLLDNNRLSSLPPLGRFVIVVYDCDSLMHALTFPQVV